MKIMDFRSRLCQAVCCAANLILLPSSLRCLGFQQRLSLNPGPFIYKCFVPPKADVVSSGPSVRLSGGITLRLFVGDPKTRKSWRADGKRIPGWFDGLLSLMGEDHAVRPTEAYERNFVVRVDGTRYRYGYFAESVPSEVIRVPHLTRDSPWDMWDDVAGFPGQPGWPNPYSTLQHIDGSLPNNVHSTDVYVGYSTEPWQVRTVYYPQTKTQVGTGVDFKVLLSSVTGPPMNGAIQLSPARYITKQNLLEEIKYCAFRFEATDSNGGKHENLPWSAANRSTPLHITRVEFQTRPFTWVKFSNACMHAS